MSLQHQDPVTVSWEITSQTDDLVDSSTSMESEWRHEVRKEVERNESNNVSSFSEGGERCSYCSLNVCVTHAHGMCAGESVIASDTLSFPPSPSSPNQSIVCAQSPESIMTRTSIDSISAPESMMVMSSERSENSSSIFSPCSDASPPPVTESSEASSSEMLEHMRHDAISSKQIIDINK